MSRLLLCFIATLALAGTAKAENLAGSASAALDDAYQTIELLKQGDVNSVAQSALNKMVRTGTEALRLKGFAEDADRLQREWNQNYSLYLVTFGFFDVGDHQPLNQWLADFVKQLRERLGDPVLKVLHLDDVDAMNYTIPVVFQPTGDRRNGDKWDRMEYGKHFVPFATIVTYWGSLYACKYIAQEHPGVKGYCGQIANILRNGMRNYVAIRLSNYIYDKATSGGQGRLNLNLGEFDATSRTKMDRVRP
jgi:hypothetical protein